MSIVKNYNYVFDKRYTFAKKETKLKIYDTVNIKKTKDLIVIFQPYSKLM